jgi:hypothetical protein
MFAFCLLDSPGHAQGQNKPEITRWGQEIVDAVKRHLKVTV